MQNNTKKIIEIILESTDINFPIPNNNLIHYDSLQDLKIQIKKDLDLIKNKKLDLNRTLPSGSGLNYFIDGTRGAGKSTFLRSIYEDFKIQDINLEKIAYIDPSLYEDNDNVLINILYSIKKLIKSKNLENHDDFLKYKTYFKKLGGGLALFNADKSHLQGIDAELFLDIGLERIKDSVEFRDNFHKLISIACTMLNCEALVIAFDDVDTNAKQAKNIMECIRKYLDTPKLIVFVTGDMELYSLLIKEFFINEINIKNYLSLAKEGLADFKNKRYNQHEQMISHLEQQYVLKLFPIKRRTQLQPLKNLISKSNINDFVITYEEIFYKKPITELISEIIIKGFKLVNEFDINLFKDFYLSLPLRALLQFLSNCAPQLFNNNKNNKNNLDLRLAISESQRSLSIGILYKYGINVDSLYANNISSLIEAVFDLSIIEGDANNTFYLRPLSSEYDIKIISTTLAIEVTNICSNKPNLFIRYMLMCLGSITVYNFLKQTKLTNIDILKSMLGFNREDNSHNWARHTINLLNNEFGVYKFDKLNDMTKSFIIFAIIKKDNEYGKRGDTIKIEDIARLNKIYQNSNDEIEINLPFNILVDLNNRDNLFPSYMYGVIDYNENYSYSIFVILGIIDKLLTLDIQDENLENNIFNILFKSYLAKGFEDNVSKDLTNITLTKKQRKDASNQNYNFNNNNELNVNLEHFKIKNKILCSNIVKWLNSINVSKNNLTPSAFFIGKIWVRFIASINKISIKSKVKNLSEIIEIQIAIFINSILIEEYKNLNNHDKRYINELEGIKLNNPLNSSQIAFENLSLISKYNYDKFDFTFLFLFCPLLNSLLLSSIKNSKYVNLLNNDNTLLKIYEKDLDNNKWDNLFKNIELNND